MLEMHLPVMENEVLKYLDCRNAGVYVDATLGDGGHAEAICRSLQPGGKVIGLDWDEEALARARQRLAGQPAKVELVHADYSELREVLDKLGSRMVQGILLDLGASTLQLMDEKRGFSFHRDGELDMRMDRRRTLTAAHVVNSYSFEQLVEIFFSYGEERWSKRIAGAIVRHREKEGPLTTGSQLAEIVKEAVPARFRRAGGHPARRVFQALRIAVNGELDNLGRVLPLTLECLAPGGRVVVIAYHSLEDRLVKKFFRNNSGRCFCPPGRPCICGAKARLKVLTARAVRPGQYEVNNNPRARSARLRAAMMLAGGEEKAGE